MSARLLRASLVLVPVTALLALVPGVSARSQAVEKSIFATVLDAQNKPITDLTAAEFGVREDNVIREVVSVKKATGPLYIQILADTTKEAGTQSMAGAGSAELIRDIRNSLTAMIHHVNTASPESMIAVMEFGQAARQVQDFTNKVADLDKAVNRLFPIPSAASVLLEAIIEGSKQLAKKPSPRRAMIILNIEPGDEQSREPTQKIMSTFAEARASMWAVSLQRGDLKNPARDVVLNRLTQVTGGRREFIVGQSAIEGWLKIYAEGLLNQYEVTFKRPEDRPAQQLASGVTRPGAKYYASIIPPK